MEVTCCGKFVGGHAGDRNCSLIDALKTIEYLKEELANSKDRIAMMADDMRRCSSCNK